MSEPDGPIPAAIAVVIRDGSALLVRRANPPDAGRWGFPGGRIEPGETLFDAAVRELREETGVRAEPLEILTALDVFGDLRHFVLIAVLCAWRSGEPVAADDATDAAWFQVADLDPARTFMSYAVDDVARRGAERLDTLAQNVHLHRKLGQGA